MRATFCLKKILTWTILSLVGILAAPAVIMGGDIPPEIIRADAGYRASQRLAQKELDCLARNVYYEAGSESFKGQLAVAQVTVNRARSGRFPRNLCDVVSQSYGRGPDKKCQFSWYCDNTKNKRLRVHESHSSYVAARKVLIEGARVPKLGTDTYFFHNLSVTISDSRAYRVISRIGNHIFYQRENTQLR